MKKELRDILKSTRADRVSGASEVTLMVCERLRVLCKSHKVGFARNELSEFALRLRQAQPNMAPIWNLSNNLLLSDLSAESAISICSHMEEAIRSAPAKIARAVARMLAGNSIVTNSSSSAVLQSLLAANELRPIRVHLTESRPMREGLLLAQELARRGVEVTLYGDASLARAVRKSNLTVVGADIVNATGVVGKVGLEHLALCAKEVKVTSLALADRSKLAPIHLQPDPRDPGEVLEHPPRGVKVENFYFEEVPLKHFRWLVTESGRMHPSEVGAILRKMRIAPELRAIALG